ERLRVQQSEEDRKATIKRALASADDAEKKGDAQLALAALDSAEANGAAADSLTLQRSRLRARLDEERTLRDGMAEVEELAATEEFEKALVAARRLEPIAARLGRDAEVKAQIATIDAARRKRELLDQ